MAKIVVQNAEIWRNSVVFHCTITFGRRSLSFAVDMPYTDVPDNVEENIRTYVQDFPNKAQMRDAEPWEGFEIEI